MQHLDALMPIAGILVLGVASVAGYYGSLLLYSLGLTRKDTREVAWQMLNLIGGVLTTFSIALLAGANNWQDGADGIAVFFSICVILGFCITAGFTGSGNWCTASDFEKIRQRKGWE